MPILDYNQTPRISVYHVRLALDQTTGFDAKVPAFVLLRGRASPPVFLLSPGPPFLMPLSYYLRRENDLDAKFYDAFFMPQDENMFFILAGKGYHFQNSINLKGAS